LFGWAGLTEQYFLWYTILLPFYLSLPSCTLLSSPHTGLLALALWVAAQVLWLQQGFQLEFLGQSTFVPGLWGAGLLFFAVNCWVLGIVVNDIGSIGNTGGEERAVGEKSKKV
jgi:GPI mannosyltransferase 1 subunit M